MPIREEVRKKEYINILEHEEKVEKTSSPS